MFKLINTFFLLNFILKVFLNSYCENNFKNYLEVSERNLAG